MTFVIVVYARGGIVLAADSRLSLNNQIPQPAQEPAQQATNLCYVGQSDTMQKLFLVPGNIGICTWGAADIEGISISDYVESFMDEQLCDAEKAVDEIPGLLADYFNSVGVVPDTNFYVAGYKIENGLPVKHLYLVGVKNRSVERYDTAAPGAAWGGETDVLVRLINEVYTKDGQGNFQPLPMYHVPWQFFTLQDAIDFAIFAVRATIETLRFQPRPKTVGGPVDVLVIKPREAFWVQQKKLHI